MNVFSKSTLCLFLYLSTSCVTKPTSVDTDYWQKLITSEQFLNEKKIYKERMVGREICWKIGVDDFLKNSSVKPQKDCIYASSKVVTQLDDGLLLINRVAGQSTRQLKVMQSTSDGFLVEAPNSYSTQVIYIYKTDEKEVVDGSFLDESNWLFYEYAGTYTYATKFASKTIYSFRKITDDIYKNVNKGLEIYNPALEYWVQNQIWTSVKNLPVPYKREPK